MLLRQLGKLARDSRRVLLAAQLAFDPTRAVAILREAGGFVTDRNGAPLQFNTPEIRNLTGIVASNAHAQVTFLKLLDPRALPAEFVRDIETYRTKSAGFKINIACERLPQYSAFDAAACGFDYPSYTHIGPTIEYLEQAYDDAKHGGISRRPFVTPVTPTAVDDSIAPPGKHIVHLFGGHAPYDLAEGDWATRKDELARNALAVVDEFAPGFSSGIIGMQVLAPPDIEAILGIPGGHIFHGELSADQLFWSRPAPHYADYRSPIRGLYQCGSSAHPGGGVGGVVGRNAAREILRDRLWRASRG